MLYEVELKLNSKDYKMKLGIKEVIKLQKLGVNLAEENSEVIDTLKVLIIGLSYNEEQKKSLFYRENNELMTLEECTDKLIQEFEADEILTFEDLSLKVNEAIDLGLNKGKEFKKKKEEQNKQIVAVDVKNF